MKKITAMMIMMKRIAGLILPPEDGDGEEELGCFWESLLYGSGGEEREEELVETPFFLKA